MNKSTPSAVTIKKLISKTARVSTFKTREINMLIKKATVLCLSLVTTLAMTGCANTDALEQNITTLTNKVDSLATEVSALKAQQESDSALISEAKAASEQAAMDAQSANERLDNMVKSYKK